MTQGTTVTDQPRPRPSSPSLGSKLLAEFVGTFFLIAAGIGIFVSTSAHADLLAVAFAHGLAIAIGVTAVGHVSGGHLNPAVTVALATFGKIKPVEALLYIVAQLAGAYLAAVSLWLALGVKASELTGSVPALGSQLGVWNGIFLEAIATFLLVWTVVAVAVDLDGAYNKLAGLPIGLAVTVGILIIGTSTGAALNPARWFGPALLTTTWNDALVWIAGPVLGGIVAAGVHLYGIRPRLAGVAVEDV